MGGYRSPRNSLEDVTVNEAECHDMVSRLQHALDCQIPEIVVVGDSRIAIQQAQGLINCNSDNLRRMLLKYEKLASQFRKIELIHAMCEFNSSADHLTSRALRLGSSFVDNPEVLELIKSLNNIYEKVMKHPDLEISTAPAAPVQQPHLEVGQDKLGKVAKRIAPTFMVNTRRQLRRSGPDQNAQRVANEDEPDQRTNVATPRNASDAAPQRAIEERWSRIRENQDAGPQSANLKKFLRGDLGQLTQK